jgi:sugar fermentation stimulation protein A
MKFPGLLLPAKFLYRQNRFLGKVKINGVSTLCYIPNPGRMTELLFRGSKIYLIKASTENRKTLYNLSLVDHQGTLVSIDSSVPNKLLNESISEGLIEPFKDLNIEKVEYTFGKSRLDFLLSNPTEKILLEVKSCTLVKDRVALFPDAPTKRGTRHLRTLIKGLEQKRSAIFFLVQRNDAKIFRPNERTDPDFTKNLKNAYNQGVEVYAYTSQISTEGIFLGTRIPLDL